MPSKAKLESAVVSKDARYGEHIAHGKL